MPREKSKSVAARIRLNKQDRNSDTGEFASNNEFIFSYSDDSSDDHFIAKRLSLIWF